MSKSIIVYSSHTGNTRELAEMIKKVLEKQNEEEQDGKVIACQDVQTFSELKVGERNHMMEEVDQIYAGFWTDKGSCEEQMSQFLHNLRDKQVFLFGTAGFGGEQTYFNQILNRVKMNLDPSNEVIGTFMCQGKMPVSVRERYESMLEKNPAMQQMIENFDRALTHPDQKDLEGLSDAIAKSTKE